MPVISKKDLVTKNKAGNGLRNKDNSGNSLQNNAAVKKLADLLSKAAEQTRDIDEASADSYKYYSDSFKTLADTPINRNTDGKISLALKALDGFEDSMSHFDKVLRNTNYDHIVKLLPKIGSNKQEFDNLLRTANNVFEMGLEKTVLKVETAEERQAREAREREAAERARQEQERQRQEQERIRQEQERQRQEQERQRQEQERQRQEQLRAQREENLGIVGAFKAEIPTQFTAALIAQKNGAKCESDPFAFINKLHTEAQTRLDLMNRFPDVEFNAEQRKVVVSVIKNTEYMQQAFRNAPGPDVPAEEQRKFIDQTRIDARALQNSYNTYSQMFKGVSMKPVAWPNSEALAADAKPSLDALYNEKDEAFVKKFSEDQAAVDDQKKQQLLKLLNEETIKAGVVSFNAIEVPGKKEPTVEEAFKHHYGGTGMTNEQMDEDGPVQMAVDDRGKAYTSTEEIIQQLSVPGNRLFVFKTDGSLPLALSNEDGRLMVSSDQISSRMQAPIDPGNKFEPKKSLDPKDIANIPSHKLIESLQDGLEEPRKQIKYYDTFVKKTNETKDDAQDWLDRHRKPKLGAMNTFKRWIYKKIIRGSGETEAYKKYRVRKDKWIANVKKRQDTIRTMDERLKAMESTYAKNKKLVAETKAKIAKLNNEYYSKNPGYQKNNIEKYRRNTEVRMEGIADIIRTGKITQNNIFANTWLAEQNVRGKKITDPGTVKNLVSYIASRSIEEKILEETIRDPEYAAARNSILVDGLNNGQAAESLSKSGLFNKMLQDQGDKPIDPDEFYTTYTHRVTALEKKYADPLYKLKSARQKLIDEFGERPITKDCLSHIAKLNVLDKWIKKGEGFKSQIDMYDKKELELAKEGERLSADDANKRQMYQNDYKGFSDSAKQVLSDIGLKIGSHTRVVDYKEFTGQEYKDALKEVHDNMQDFAVKLEQSGVFDDMTNEQKIRFNGVVDNLKLEGSEVTVDFTKHEKMSESELNDIIEKGKYEGEEKEWNIKYYQEKGNTRTSDPLRTKGNLELSGTQTFRLDKMTEMVNKTVEHNRTKEAETEMDSIIPQVHP